MVTRTAFGGSSVLKRMEEVVRVILAVLWPGTMLKHFQRVVGVAALSTALAGGLIAPAIASGPVIVDVAFTINGPYGPGPCSLWAMGSGTRHVETFSDASGNPVLVRRHVIFTGTVSNMATGEVVPYVGDFTVTRDVMADTNTYTGLFRETAVPGQPPIIAAGQMVTTADFPPQLISESGRTIDAWLAAVCQLTGS
jgi:hypothetical protein